MSTNIFKRTFALVIFLVMLICSIPLAVSAEGNTVRASSGMTVSVNEKNVTIQVSGIGTSGTAKVYRYGADEYHTKDALHGMSKSLADAGVEVGSYSCGTSQTITIDRYNSDGTDNLYEKYYVVQNGKILAGPVYATSIASVRAGEKFERLTKKGLIAEDFDTVNTAKEMGVGATVINHSLTEMILANEDAKGNPIDNSKRTDVIPFVSNGETFYFSSGYMAFQDTLISEYSKAGINVTMVVIAWDKMLTDSYPESLIYTKENRQTMAFNTANARGAKYWVAAMEFLADRYSQSADKGLVNKFVIGNEIDYTYDWYLLEPLYDENGKAQRVDFDVFMEEYMRTVRLANNAVKKYNSNAQVAISLTHNWAESNYDSYSAAEKDRPEHSYNSYAPKDMLDWVFKYDKARGDFDWGITAHPYPIGTKSSNPVKDDPAWKSYYKPTTGDWKTTPFITASNLELYDLYFGQEDHLYNGKMRFVSLTETSICSEDESKVSSDKYTTSTYQQAASIAQYYYRAACVDCIDEIDYFQLTDQATNKLGLRTVAGTNKPAYDVWKYVDKENTFEVAGQYLKYIDSNAKSYKDIMTSVKSEFDWNKKWDESKIIAKTKSTVPEMTETVRIFGSNRYETAFKAANELKALKGGGQFDTVIIACGTNFADALAGSYLAAVKDAPILLVDKARVAKVTTYIKSNLKAGGTVYILGGENAVPKNMESGLAGFEVKRFAGSNRYATNLMILKEAGTEGKDILVATGTNFADSLSASATGMPILLVNKKLTADQKAFLKSSTGKKYILGGENAVSADVEKELKAYGTVERLGGSNRYTTSTLIAETFFENPKSAVLSYALNFPDGLCGGVVAYKQGAPMLLVIDKNGAKAATTYAKKVGIKNGYALGGTGLISDATMRQIFSMDAGDSIGIK